jgi:hypothetical protein
MITQEQKDLWVNALESGKYPQCRGQLRMDMVTETSAYTSYCCLGVLATVLKLPFRDNVNLADEDGTSANYRPLENLLSPSLVPALWGLNDGTHGNKEHTFPEIAAWIKENVKVADGQS